MTETDILIIGSGMAGYTLLREIRKLDRDVNITLICSDNGVFYSKPMLSNALDKQKTPETLVTQSAEKIVESQDFNLIANTLVTHIDTSGQYVYSEDQSWHYQSLVLATGARPIRLPITGTGADDIMSINHLDHYRHFYNKLRDAQRIAIIGPGLIGCEFANDLIKANKNISIIGPDPWPISTLLPESVGQFLQQKLEHIGIRFFLQNTVSTVDKTQQGYQLELEQGQSVDADLVMSAVGLHANLDLAENNNLLTQRGYVTDEFLRCSEPNVFALGDCAQVEGHYLPFILPIMQSARALAKTLSGEETAVSYPAMPVAIKTPACPLVVAPPPNSNEANWQISETPDGIQALHFENDQLTGFALAGDRISEKQTLTKQLPALL